MQTSKAWLGEASWASVVGVHRSLCQAQEVSQQRNHKFEAAQQLWEANHGKKTTLLEALDLCRRCNDLRPFLFHCSNTFTSLGKNLVEDWARQLSSVEAQILRTTVTHYIDGQVGAKELNSVLNYLKSKPQLAESKSQTEAQILPSVRQRQPA